MADKSAVNNLLALLLALNLLFFAAVHGQSPAPPCRTNALADVKVCASVLLLLKLKVNVPSSEQCCPLLAPLADLDAVVCLCAAVKANVLGIPVNVPLDLPLMLNYCGKNASAAGSNCVF